MSVRRWGLPLVATFASLLGSLAFAQPVPSTRPAVRSATSRPALAIPQTPGTHRLSTYVSVDGRSLKLPFVLFLPSDYRPAGPKMPVLLFLHGSGECGTDLDAIFLHGPNFELAKPWNGNFTREFPMIVISPQCPPRGQRWDRDNMDRYLNALLDVVLPKLNADVDRVYATGLSMGGLGTWYVTRDRPDRFAAIAPISSVELDPDATAPKLARVPALTITGIGDLAQIDQSRHMVQKLRQAGDIAEFVTGPDGHAVWVRAYASPRTYEWLLLNHRGQDTNEILSPASKPGVYRRAFRPADPASRTIDYVVRVPESSGGTDTRPLLIHFPDPNEFGTMLNNLPLHGPLAFMAHSGAGPSLPFIVVSPMLPPFAFCEWQQEDLSPLIQTIKQAADQYHADPARIYISGRGEGVKLALELARRPELTFAATVIEVNSQAPFPSEIQGDQGAPSALIAITDRPDGDVHQRLKAMVGHSPAGSELVVSKTPDQSAFTQGDLYTRLLRTRPTQSKP